MRFRSAAASSYERLPDNNLFGFFNYASSAIVYHYDMGYEAVVQANDAANGVCLYDFASGHWLYTNSVSFPSLYDFTLKTWITTGVHDERGSLHVQSKILR
jgi:hypothetical protein